MNFEYSEEELESESGESVECNLENERIREIREIAESLLENYKFFDENKILEVAPEKEVEDVPVFASPGWGVAPETWENSLKIISDECKRKVITTEYSREEIVEGDVIGKEIPVAQFQKALTIISILNSRGLECVDGIGHSEGGLNLAIAATLFPERFRNLLFVSPAGFIDVSKEELIKRFAVDEGLEEMRGMDMEKILLFKKYLKNVAKNFFENISLANKEVNEMTELDIFSMTEGLKEKGMGIGFMAGANDKVFTIDEINNRVSDENVDHYITTKGNHGAIIFDEKHAHLAGNVLHDMMMKKKAKESEV